MPDAPFGYFSIELHAQDDDYPALIDVSSFLYDLNLMYEIMRLATGVSFAREERP